MQKLIGYCKSIEEVVEELYQKNIKFVINDNELTVESGMDNDMILEFFKEKFYCTNLKEVDALNITSIKFCNLDIHKIIEFGKCDESIVITASFLGNGMIVKSFDGKYYIVINHNYTKGEIDIVQLKEEEVVEESIRNYNLNLKDLYLCENMQGKKGIINMSCKITILSDDENYFFCGYVNLNKYYKIVNVDKRLLKNGMVHDFTAYQKQKGNVEFNISTSQEECKIDRIKKASICGVSKVITAKKLGNGMIIEKKFQNNQTKLFIVINKNVDENKIELVEIILNKSNSGARVFKIALEDLILCDDVRINTISTKVNMSKKIIIDVDKSEYLFYGYITKEKYSLITSVNRRISLDKNVKIEHDFIRFERQIKQKQNEQKQE